jgi:hypothetical protein
MFYDRFEEFRELRDLSVMSLGETDSRNAGPHYQRLFRVPGLFASHSARDNLVTI